jgi:hypothetical protein
VAPVVAAPSSHEIRVEGANQATLLLALQVVLEEILGFELTVRLIFYSVGPFWGELRQKVQ